jgi:integrase
MTVASIFKAKGAKRYTILYFDENGDRRKKTGATDKAVTERIARDIENRVALRREGLVDAKDEAYKAHADTPLSEHLSTWADALEAKGATPKHIGLSLVRARRIVALVRGAKLADIDPGKTVGRSERTGCEATLFRRVEQARLSDLTAERVQKTLATLRREGRSLQTCNHYLASIVSFANWCYDTYRLRENPLRGLERFNAKEDRRHDRRTISLEELQRLIEATDRGPVVVGLTGPVRSLCYRLAASTGLRYSEIASVRPASFNWKASSVTVSAAYTKNGDPATLPIPRDLAGDLRSYVATLPPETPVFPLPKKGGAEILRVDLDAAGIPYRDAAGLVFDFHSLRCEMATLLDAAGVSPRVVQRLMRHSTLELTGRYTRPRVADIEAAASKLPSLKPEGTQPEAAVMTGTDPVPMPSATGNATGQRGDERNTLTSIRLASLEERSWYRSCRLAPSLVCLPEATHGDWTRKGRRISRSFSRADSSTCTMRW